MLRTKVMSEADRNVTIRQVRKRSNRTKLYGKIRPVCMLFAFVLGGCNTLSGDSGFDGLFSEQNPELSGDPTAQAGVDYTIEVRGLGIGDTPGETVENARMLEIVKTQARVFKLQDNPPPSVALLKRRASSDIALVERALKSEGYYEGTAVITVDNDKKTNPRNEELTKEQDRLNTFGNTADNNEQSAPIFADIADPVSTPVVNIFVRKGPRYSLARQQVDIATEVDPGIEEQVREAAAVNVGGPAQGLAVVEAEQAALGALNKEGRPYASKGERRAEANFDFDTLDIITKLDPGPLTIYGETQISGLRDVEEAYIRDFITWKKGEQVSRATLRDVQRALSGTRLFDSVTVEIPATPPADLAAGEVFTAPVTITAEESKHRTIGGGLSFSTTDGAGINLKWDHRNLRGQNEQLTLEADVDQESQSAGVTYTKPRFDEKDRDLIGSFSAFREETDAFDIIGLETSIGLKEKFSEHLKGSIGLGLEASQTEQNGQTLDSYLVGIPVTLTYDNSDNLLDPTEGIRAAALIAPWAGLFDEEETGFVIVDLNGSTYIPFDRDRNYVLAVRGRTAAVFAESLDRVPANRRLYSGGGGSVRAFENQSVGPLGSNDDPTGGLTAAEIGIDLRLRRGAFGVVPFFDAGVVSEELFSDYDRIRYGAGLGLRYFSPVGPIRLDVAIPLNRRSRDRSFQFYISIGQAF